MGTSELLVRLRDTGALPDLNDSVGTGALAERNIERIMGDDF
jgi:hypothetical protein